MRILHIVPYFQPEFGYEEFFHSIAQNKLGHKVYVITSKYYNPLIKGGKRIKITNNLGGDDGLTTFRLKSIEIPKSCQNILLGIKKIISRIKPDFVYVHGPQNILSIQTYFVINRNVRNYFIDVHESGYINDSDKLYYFRGIINIFKHFINKFQFAAANKVIFYSENVRKEYICKYSQLDRKTLQCSIGVSLDRFYCSSEARQEIRAQYNIGENSAVGVITGRMIYEKRHDLLIRALKKYLPQMTLIMVGTISPDYLHYLKSLNENIIYCDSIENSLLYRIYSAADIGFWVSNYSVGILETYACGVPAILGKSGLKYYPAVDPRLVVNNDDYYKAALIAKKISNDIYYLNQLKQKAINIAKESSYDILARKVINQCSN